MALDLHGSDHMMELHIQVYLRQLDNQRTFLTLSAFEGVRQVTGRHTAELRTNQPYWFPETLSNATSAEFAAALPDILAQVMHPF